MALRARPHVLLMLADDWGSYDARFIQRSLGRSPDVSTPAIDEMAGNGVFLSSYYVQPICTPTRASLLTGRFSAHTGCEHTLFGPSEPSCLPRQLPLLPHAFTALGYQCHMVGKWHLGYPNASCAPWGRGFASYLGYLNGNEGYYHHGLGFATDMHRCQGLIEDGRAMSATIRAHESDSGTVSSCDKRVCHARNGTFEGSYSMHIYTSRVQELLDGWAREATPSLFPNHPAAPYTACSHPNMRRGPSQTLTDHPQAFQPTGGRPCDCDGKRTSSSRAPAPLFIYIAWQSVHEPLEEPPPLLGNFRGIRTNLTDETRDRSRQVYTQMLASMDEGIGNITATLERNAMLNNTVMVRCYAHYRVGLTHAAHSQTPVHYTLSCEAPVGRLSMWAWLAAQTIDIFVNGWTTAGCSHP